MTGGSAGRRFVLRILRSIALLMVLAIPAAFAHGQISVGIGIGPVVSYPAPVYVSGPPVCSWGYYSYYPYSCAPYGYYGADWFFGGVFIGAGPWYTGWYGHPWGWGWAHPWGGWGWVRTPTTAVMDTTAVATDTMAATRTAITTASAAATAQAAPTAGPAITDTEIAA